MREKKTSNEFPTYTSDKKIEDRSTLSLFCANLKIAEKCRYLEIARNKNIKIIV